MSTENLLKFQRPSNIHWKTTLLTAHVETTSGPTMHMLRASIDDGSTYEVEANGDLETNHAGSMVFVSGQELVFALDTPIEHEADASLVVVFEVEEPTSMEIHTVGEMGEPPVVVRSLTDDTILVVGPDSIIIYCLIRFIYFIFECFLCKATIVSPI